MTAENSVAARGVLGFALACLFCGCDNSPTYTPFISSVGAGFNSHSVASGTTTLAVSGSFFMPGVVVFWNGKRQATRYQSNTRLDVDLDAGLTKNAGKAELTAQNDGSLLCDPFAVEVFQERMTLTAVSPQQIALGAPDTTISVTGTGFRATDVVLWNGVQLATTVQSATAVAATVPASLLVVPGDGFVRVSDPGCTAAPLCTSLSTGMAIQVGPSIRNKIGGDVFDIAWDTTDSLLLVTRSRFADESIVDALDPVSGAVVRTSVSGALRRQLAVSDQDQFVYSFSPSHSSPPTTVEPERYSLPGLSNGVTLTGFFTEAFFGSPAAAQHLVPAPGAPATVAILTTTVNIVDGTVGRPNTGDANVMGVGVGALEWGFDASTLYGLVPRAPGVALFTVDGTGVVARTVLGSTQFDSLRLHFDRTTRRLYGDYGENVNEQGVDPRPFAVLGGRRRNCTAAIDGALGKAFFACNDDDFGLTVQSFDLATQQRIANILLGPAVQEPERIIRFASDGLAVAADGAIYIYRGPFVH